MSSLLSAELAATCNALGYFDTKANKYYADSNTLETVKDLIRYLRKDDEDHEIRRQLGETKVVQTDLLPLLKNYWEETELFDVLLRLVVNLTTPALVLWNEELPTEKTARNYYLQIEDHLQNYKQAFADEAVWAVLSTRISKILEIDYAERGDENSLIIERILILIRNILYVPSDPDAERRPDNDASVHDQVLWALHQSGMLDIIIYVSSSTMEQAYYMHILEILSFMLREQSASELASAALQRSQMEKMRDEAELLAIRHRETSQRQQKVKIFSGTRHSRFGGTFVVKSMKSISDNELIYHKPLSKLDALNFDVDKQNIKTPRNRLPIQSTSTERRSAFSIRLFLKEFCIEFLNGAYNTLMREAKRNLVRGKLQANDESYYLWALRFFMEFNRCYKFEVKLVSETMSVQMFHFVQQQMEKHFDMINQDKKKLRLWSRRLHLALLAYRELLLTINMMDKSSIESVRHSAKIIKSNIFYVLEYRELVLTLLVTFDELKMSEIYLNDLIECQHIFLKMLQNYSDKENSQIVVQKRARTKKKSRKTNGDPASEVAASGRPEMNLENRWDEVGPQLSVVLDGRFEIPSDLVPFDATSEVPIDDQKSETMKNIQRKLRNHEFENAIGLLRAAREVWPENDCFGSNNMAPEEEFLALRDIFFADLGENQPERRPPEEPQEFAHNYNEESNEEEEEMENDQMTETDFKFEDFAKRLAHPKVVRACGLALKNFERNSTMTNHCIIKLLHRVAWDCKMASMIFQVSIFRTFQKIYEMKAMPQFKELIKFANYMIREFIRIADSNPKVYMEALFWKSSRDAYEIEEGYGSYNQKSAAAAKAWSELEEDELRRLFMEHQEKQVEEDVVDWILNNLINNTRSRRGVLKKLKEMYLLNDYKGRVHRSANNRPPRHWSEDEEAQLRELFEQFKDAMYPLGCIMDRLDMRRPKNRIVEKLLVMGLVQDKKELRKKRGKKSRDRQGTDPESDSLESESDEDATDRQTSNSEDVRNGRRGCGGGGRGGGGGGGAHNSRRTTERTPNQRRKKSSKQFRASKKDLAKLLMDTAKSGMSEALEWIRESFSDAAEDMENDPDTDETGIPLVPILDCSVSAMEDSEFQKLLLAFGIKKPADEQEIYWRIHSDLNHIILKEHCDMIAQALNGTLNVEDEVPNQEVGNNQEGQLSMINNEESSDDEYVFGSLRKNANNNVRIEQNNKNDEIDNIPKNDEIVQDETGNSSKNSVQKKRKIRRPVESDSDESGKEDSKETMNEELSARDNVESPDYDYIFDSLRKNVSNDVRVEQSNEIKKIVESPKGDEAGSSPKNIQKKRKIKRFVESDSEASDKEENTINEDENVDNGKRLRLSDSESDKPKQKKGRILDSDDED